MMACTWQMPTLGCRGGRDVGAAVQRPTGGAHSGRPDASVVSLQSIERRHRRRYNRTGGPRVGELAGTLALQPARACQPLGRRGRPVQAAPLSTGVLSKDKRVEHAAALAPAVARCAPGGRWRFHQHASESPVPGHGWGGLATSVAGSTPDATTLCFPGR